MNGLTKFLTLREAPPPLDADRVRKLRSMILAILDEPIEDESSNDRLFKLAERRMLASLLEPRPLQ